MQDQQSIKEKWLMSFTLIKFEYIDKDKGITR